MVISPTKVSGPDFPSAISSEAHAAKRELIDTGREILALTKDMSGAMTRAASTKAAMSADPCLPTAEKKEDRR
jgi:hypothetical protein